MESKDNIDKVLKEIHLSKVIGYLRNLISIRSYVGTEWDRSEYVAKEMERLGMEVREVYVSPKRKNVIGILRGNGTGKSLMLSAHLDNHWWGAATASKSQETELHTAKIEDGKIFGVGTDDNLTPIACYLGFVDAANKAEAQLGGDLLIATSVGESEDCIGARWIAESGIKADMGIVGEPTNLDIGIVGAGRTEVEIRVKGVAPIERTPAFAERLGFKVVNAVVSMHKLINYLLKMEQEDAYFQATHPLLHGKGADLYIGSIIGGDYNWGCLTQSEEHDKCGIGDLRPESITLHKVPTWCNLRVGARYWPGQTSEGFFKAINKWIEKAKQEDPSIEAEVRVVLDKNEPQVISPDAEVVRILKNSIKYVTGKEPSVKGYSMMTDAPYFCESGIPTVLCHPINWPRVPIPWITLEELMIGCRVYGTAALNACGLR